MHISLRQIVISLIATMLSVLVIAYMARNAAAMGLLSLPLRALLLSTAVVAAMIAVYPFNALFARKPGLYALFVCLPATLPGLVYFLYLLPQQAGTGVSGEQLRSELITDRSSNGFVEVGFSYPIYTPTITITNNEIFTRQLNVFLRIEDANNQFSLFRAVRANIPGNSLSVEATVRGLLSENDGFLFLPVVIPPVSTVEGKVIFIISNLADGSTFTEALGRAYQANFELREPETGELLFEFSLNHL